MIIYFKGTGDIFGINLEEQEKSLQFRLIKTNYCTEQRNLLIENMKEKWNFSRDQGDMLSTPPPPPERPLTVNVKLGNHLRYARAFTGNSVGCVPVNMSSLYKMPGT